MKTINNEIDNVVLVTSVLNVGNGDSIKHTVTSNNIEFSTAKLRCQVSIHVGKEQVIDMTTKLPVSIAKQGVGKDKIDTLHLPMPMLLSLASNGLFEILNTNVRNPEQWEDYKEALQNGYLYPSSYKASLKIDGNE